MQSTTSLRLFLASTTPLPGPTEFSGIPEVTTQGPTPPHSPPLAAQASAHDHETLLATKGGRSARSGKGGAAAHIIAEECERLFCETLKAVFSGEGITSTQDSLAMGARNDIFKDDIGDIQTELGHTTHIVVNGLGTPPSELGLFRGSAPFGITQWLEIWDYSGGVRFRGFTMEGPVESERTMFVFFDEAVVGKDLKQGLMALIELASATSFTCTELVICLDRSAESSPLGKALLRDLGWVGFELVTLARWVRGVDVTSEKWLFMGMEV